jgi:hypothetical protein
MLSGILYRLVTPWERTGVINRLKPYRYLLKWVKMHPPGWPSRQLKNVRFFSDREQLAKMAADLVDDLFLHATHQAGKETWCEKTPSNLMHIDFLWELFPDSAFIHVKRDPRGVINSFSNQFWAIEKIRDSALSLREVYKRWFALKEGLDFNRHKYLEIKLEDIAASQNSAMERIAAFCGVDNSWNNVPEIRTEKVNYWQETLTEAKKEEITQILEPYIQLMGYEV